MGEIETKAVLKQLVSFQSEINVLLDQEMERFLEPLTPEIGEILNYYYTLGGKKMRPALFLAIAKAFDSDENLAPHALALELIHTMSLYHDDVIDNAKERRGAPTVHEKWNQATAIVGGDILHAIIHGHILKAIENKSILYADRAMRFLQDLIYLVELPIGSAVIDEMRFSESKVIPELADSLKTTVGKTAPLFAFSASAGAYLSGQTSKIAEDMFEMGTNMGQAFQLLDDIGDYFENNKDIGGDLREDKKTPILILAYKKNPQLVDKYREKGESLTSLDIIQFRSIFKEEMLTVLGWANSHLEAAMSHLNLIPNNTNKQYVLALFTLLQLQIKKFNDKLNIENDNGI
ncbi:MAG: polyprenyl synthetase family protein [Candidatus Heimdallarchaeota archaeon]|nr:polyprenyl synthetase family protein [Candidatus Heimdallarchaeota archaeon]